MTVYAKNAARLKDVVRVLLTTRQFEENSGTGG